MTIVDRGSWGKVPWDLACHCQNCDLVSAAPDGRCVECGSESVYPLKREEPGKSAAEQRGRAWKLDPGAAYLIQLGEVHRPDGLRLLARKLEKSQLALGRVVMVAPHGNDKLFVMPSVEDVLEKIGRHARLQTVNGEPVLLPAGAVMGAEMIAPEQRNVRGDDAV